MAEIKELEFFEFASNAAARAAFANDGSLIVSTFDSSGTWVCPDGVFEIIVECWGGGGNGYEARSWRTWQNNRSTSAGAGGGGGAYSKRSIPVVPGNTYTIHVGGAGGDTYFENVSTVLAKGGAHAFEETPGVGGQASAGVGDIKYSGGQGGSGNRYETNKYSNPPCNGGGGGGAATANSNGTNGNNLGAGGYYGGGYGGDSGTGGPGLTPGGGGGGGDAITISQPPYYQNYPGGPGAPGQLKISYYPVHAYSEDTIKTQGSYSLKVGACPTSSLNKSLIRTLSPTKDFRYINTLHLDIRAARAGANVRIGIRDSGGVITEITPNISTADTWQTVDWDISGTLNANKNALDAIIITIVNADTGNVIYLDNFYGDFTAPAYSLEDVSVELRDKDGILKKNLTPFISSLNWMWNRLGGCGKCTINLDKRQYRSIAFTPMDNIQLRMSEGVVSKRLYQGFVDEVSQSCKDGSETIVLKVQGYSDLLKKLIVHTSGDTRTYTNQKISVIVADIVDTFITPHTFISRGTIDTGTFTVDKIEFYCTVAEALQKLAELSGDIEYGVNENLEFYWRRESDVVRHKFFVGGDIKSLQRLIKYGNVVNKIYFKGGTTNDVTYKTIRDNAQSQADNFLSESIEQNGSVTTDAVAHQLLDTKLAETADPEICYVVEVENSSKRLEDDIPMGKIVFFDPNVGGDEESFQLKTVTYTFGSKKSRLNLKIETGDTILETSAKILRMEQAINNARQYS